jgi:hypothetical protein
VSGAGSAAVAHGSATAGTVRLSHWATPTSAKAGTGGIDLLSPVWHVLDLLPGGRGDREPSEGH